MTSNNNTSTSSCTMTKRGTEQVLGPITADGERPQKKFYRQRAHCNPLAHNDTFVYPSTPSDIDWTIDHYPTMMNEQQQEQQQCEKESTGMKLITPTVLDIGCGFGGLTMALASILPNEIVLGMEIRAKVTEYVRLRIANARREHMTNNQQQEQQKQKPSDEKSIIKPDDDPTDQPVDETTVTTTTNSNTCSKRQNRKQKKSGPNSIEPNEKVEHRNTDHHYNNCSVLRTNSMKFLQNYLYKHSIQKIFICFPDPHFKRKNHPRRIITVRLLTEYAYILQKGNGKLYCITDVEELHQWHIAALTEHPLFEPILTLDDDDDKRLVDAMQNETEEGQKVTRNKGQKFFAIYRRVNDDEQIIQGGEINSTNFFL